MRLIKNGLAAIAATALISSPVLAQAAQPVAKVSNAVRAKAATEKENELAGGSGIIVAVLAAAAIIGGIVVAADSQSNEPTSP
ncbi:MAG: hypothetical protein U5J78_06465 [Parasphingorhabdus sp.]|nr:hypothetical protein [Parasphingorhabdus sp.]